VADGTARCWGGGEVGQLGNGGFVRRPVPVVVNGLINAVALAAGRAHTCALLTDGTVACWGAGGLLGNARRVSVVDADTHCAGVRPQTCT
jgi:alpha-tubulin suppressor-like RCC1 family protein